MAVKNIPTALKSNSLPQGGPVSTQPVAPSLTPADIQAVANELQPVVTAFREQSTLIPTQLDDTTLKLGSTVQNRIDSVGLGVFTVTEHSVSVKLANTATTSQTVNLSQWAPYNGILKTTVGVNGATSTYNASGIQGLLVAGRMVRGMFKGFAEGNGLSQAFQQNNISTATNVSSVVSSSILNPSITGITSFDVTASSDATITFNFITVEKLAYSKDAPLGAMPLQNNQVFATINRTLAASLLGDTAQSMFYVSGGAPSTLTATLNSWTTKTEYDFWSIPANPALYSDFINNTFQVAEVDSFAVAVSGQSAFRYDLPDNMYLVALHFLGLDNNGKYLSFGNSFTKAKISYNGDTVTPVNMYMNRLRAKQFQAYDADVNNIPGYVLWDGDDTSDNITQSDSSGWINLYSVSSPKFIADIATGQAMPLQYSITRETIIAGAVNQVG